VDEAAREALVEQIVVDHEAIFRALRADASKEWLVADLTFPQLRALFLLERLGGLSMSALAEALGRAQPTVTGLVDRLVEHGLVQRAEQPTDRRITLIQLSAAGQALIDNLTLAGNTRTRQLIDRLPIEELRLVAASVAILRREALALAADRPAGPPALARPISPSLR
jgi:DNA-binding MarR family transcriptional regulator